MRSENIIEERVNGLCLFAKLSVSLRTESSLQVSERWLASSRNCFPNLNEIHRLQLFRGSLFVTRYFIYGMQDAQNLERVKLDFSIFDIPRGEQKPKSE